MLNTINIHLANMIIWAGSCYYALQNIGHSIHFLVPLIAAFMLLVMTNGIRDGVKQHAKVALVVLVATLAFLMISSIPHFYSYSNKSLELGIVIACFVSGLIAIISYIRFIKSS